ncbi:MAG TPA: DNA damage-inducible protein D [Coxiellaceae bacterium]|nr:MAG: DNA damage-inducible protein D [Gammaproteobacteria bacterium RIFCSPHIGHO2_12_FULL_36_30]HLB56633.1 DNA damage-inducible protein D [Coxiellaceae bacterium]
MNKQNIAKLKLAFDEILKISKDDVQVEFCYARDLAKVLEYNEWRNFLMVVDKAKISCKNSKVQVSDHFVDVNNMVIIGSAAERRINDIMLTRYACYLVAQNADSRKESVAFAQTYFALQTRKQELLEERLSLQDRFDARDKLRKSETELSKNIFERGVDDDGFARIRSKGDAALFDGKNTQEMKKQLQIPKNRPLADFLPTITIAAKNLATEMTNFNVEQHDLHDEYPITDEHVQNNVTVRNMLGERGIKPEALPPSEDLQKLSRRQKTLEKKLIKESALPDQNN